MKLLKMAKFVLCSPLLLQWYLTSILADGGLEWPQKLTTYVMGPSPLDKAVMISSFLNDAACRVDSIANE